MAARDRLPPSKNTFKKTGRLLDDFFKVDEYHGSYELPDNTMSAEQRLLVFERGDSVAALLFDPVKEEVILVEQFRLPTVANGMRRGWILEPAAGMMREGETARQTIARELLEETGFHVKELVPIHTFFVSPGGTSERIHLFYAEVRRHDQLEAGGGVVADGESTTLVRLPVNVFFAKLRNQEFEDAKLIIAGQWLRERRALLMASASPSEQPMSRVVAASRTRGTDRRIVCYRGDIREVKGIDVWVNPLSTDMLLDRFADRTVSAAIRLCGAEKYPDSQRVMRDSIGEGLMRAMGGRNFVKPGTVIDASPGQLAKSHGVKRLLHVATAKGEIGENVAADADSLDRGMENILEFVGRSRRYKSLLVPMLGTGDGGLPVTEVAPRLLRAAIDFLENNAAAKLQKICFLAYSSVDFDVLEDAMRSFELRFVPPDQENAG